MMSPEKLNDLRQRVLTKQPVTPEELAEAIAQLRNGRALAADTSAASKTSARKKAGKQTPEEAQAELDDLLGNLKL